jgi:hypothetical protein
MSNCDLELRRLEDVLRQARRRLEWITRTVTDSVARKAAEELCAKALAAVAARRAKGN